MYIPGLGPFLEGSEKFSYLQSRSKISNLIITELFYSHILNMARRPVDQWVFVLDRWVFVLDRWVFVLDRWVFVLDRWVFVLDQWVFVSDQWVFVLDHRVLGLRSSFLGLRFRHIPQVLSRNAIRISNDYGCVENEEPKTKTWKIKFL